MKRTIFIIHGHTLGFCVMWADERGLNISFSILQFIFTQGCGFTDFPHGRKTPKSIYAIDYDTTTTLNINLQNFPNIVDANYPLNKSTLLGVLKHSSDESLYYDKEGKVWSSTILSEGYKPTFMDKLLAYTFYNPILDIKRSWVLLRDYDLQELKGRICHCIDKDDDILTQFVEGDILKLKISNCTDFNSIVDTLFKYVFKPDEEQIFREFPVEE